MIGSAISHYKIVEKLGEGGMGVVYKAEDIKLKREVALKFLAAHLLSDAEAKDRFLREAQAAAALHHPNVCPVHEIDEVEGKTFLAMAFLEGETLEDRIAEGPLSLKESLDIARQVAEGLQAAHSKGVFHRDIKPANIIVSDEGRATIMDFGLARLTEASRLTKVDTAMGTVAYMSPEQAQGMEVDGRTDIWALGCVLYEMISGQRPFQGQYDQALLYEIVHEEPAPLTSLRTGVPVELEFVVGKCLTKDHGDRPESAKEVAKELRTLAEKLKSGRSTILRTAQMTGAVPAAMTGAHTLNPAATLPPDAVVVGKRRLQAVYGLAAALALALLASLAFIITRTPPERTVTRFSFAPEGLTAASISPDGRYIAFTAETNGESSLWLRAIGSETAREIPGAEGARPVADSWSPDSQSIVFATRTEIKRVAIEGGDPVTLGGLPGTAGQGFRGASWSPDGERIVFSSTGGTLWEIPARGGEPKILREMTAGHVEPYFLPTGAGPDALVYEAASRIWVLNLATGERSEVGPGSAPVYSRDGYLIHGPGDASDSRLFALPFSLETLEPTGEAFPIAEGGEFASVAQDGTLVFLDGANTRIQTLVWRNREGELLETIGQAQLAMRHPALSPDGQRIAVTSNESGGADIWIHDLARSTKTRLTFGAGSEVSPTWSPSGREIAYTFIGDQVSRLMSIITDGTGEPAVLAESPYVPSFPNWARDGRTLAYFIVDPKTGNDVFHVEFGADGGVGEPIPVLSTPVGETNPNLSPDGRFLAYCGDESGPLEVYVVPFPDGAGKQQVSVNGGGHPRWRSDGSELYYLEGDALMMVPVSTEQGPAFGRPQKLFEDPNLVGSGVGSTYDVSSDGQRFVTIAPVENSEGAAPPKIRVVENWYEEFRDRE